MSKGLLDGLRMEKGSFDKRLKGLEKASKSQTFIDELNKQSKSIKSFNSQKKERKKREYTLKNINVMLKGKYYDYLNSLKKPENSNYKKFGTARRIYLLIDEHRAYKEQIDKQCGVLKTSITQLESAMAKGDNSEALEISKRIKTFLFITKLDESFLMNYLNEDQYNYLSASQMLLSRNEYATH